MNKEKLIKILADTANYIRANVEEDELNCDDLFSLANNCEKIIKQLGGDSDVNG